MLRKMSVVMTALCCAMLIAGCDNDKNTPTGTATVRGELTSVAPTITVPAVVAGIRVDLLGPVDLSTVTDANGVFEFTNVPAGEYTIVFYVDGKRIEYSITVPEDGDVIMAHVSIDEHGNVTVTWSTERADIAGDWTFNQQGGAAVPAGVLVSEKYLSLSQNGRDVTGTLGWQYNVTGIVMGRKVTFNFELISVPTMVLLNQLSTAQGVVNVGATYMSGTWVGKDGSSGTWTATRGKPSPSTL